MVVLDTKIYNNIVSDILENTKTLQIIHEKYIVEKYKQFPEDTIRSIVSQEYRQVIKKNHYKILNNITKYIDEYNNSINDDFFLLNLAKRLNFSPISFARLFLQKKFSENFSRLQINEMLRNPNLIDDPKLACNIANCIYNDKLDGPITDIIRKSIGEEYEIRLKILAKNSGIVFYDENDLRRTGFDKTPDMKLAIPFLFRGKIVHWIESKALFGSHKAHLTYIDEQLLSYSNR